MSDRNVLKIQTLNDLAPMVIEHLEAMGVETDHEELREVVADLRIAPFDDHQPGSAEMDTLVRRCWDAVTDGAEWPDGVVTVKVDGWEAQLDGATVKLFDRGVWYGTGRWDGAIVDCCALSHDDEAMVGRLSDALAEALR